MSSDNVIPIRPNEKFTPEQVFEFAAKSEDYCSYPEVVIIQYDPDDDDMSVCCNADNMDSLKDTLAYAFNLADAVEEE